VLAHEFGHYLRHRHELEEFLCSQRDMIEWDREDQLRETDANQFASYLLMPIDDFRRQLAGQQVTVDCLGRCAERYGVSLTSAILKWLEFTEERAVLVIARDGFILWSRSSAPALRTGAYFRTRNITCPVPEMSVASGRWGALRERAGVALPPGGSRAKASPRPPSSRTGSRWRSACSSWKGTLKPSALMPSRKKICWTKFEAAEGLQSRRQPRCCHPAASNSASCLAFRTP
jgi:hypothetical protein